jgi:hypothetical protein
MPYLNRVQLPHGCLFDTRFNSKFFKGLVYFGAEALYLIPPAGDPGAVKFKLCVAHFAHFLQEAVFLLPGHEADSAGRAERVAKIAGESCRVDMY